MKTALLFWCYANPDLCGLRVRRLRELNPDAPIYVLYGGTPEEEASMHDALRLWIDDWWTFDDPRDGRWRWRNGDLMIAAWHRQRGRCLEWDRVFIVQWDMVLAQPVDRLLEGVGENRLLLSGLRPVSEVWWWWTWIRGIRHRDRTLEFLKFQIDLRLRRRWWGSTLCCLFIVATLPRAFLERYSREATELGFLEYKVPTLARAWGFSFVERHQFNPYWAKEPLRRGRTPGVRAFNAIGLDCRLEDALCELAKPDGLRVFHPVSDPRVDEAVAAAPRAS